MHILFLTQVLPYPLDAGPKVRAYYVLRHLARTHDVTLVSFVRATDSAAAIAHLQSHCRAVYTVPIVRSHWQDLGWLGKSLLTAQPFLIARDWVPAMARLLAQLVGDESQSVGAIHADQLWMAPYALWASRHRREKPKLTLDQHNAVHLIPRRMAQTEPNPLKRLLLRREARQIARYECTICRQFDAVTWVTEDDYQAVAALDLAAQPLPKSAIIPICVEPLAEPPVLRQPAARRVTFVGGLHYPPNAQGIRWFAQQVFPLVLQAVPDAILTVIGKQPPGLHRLGLPAQNLAVPGFVADVRPYLAESAVFIVPLHAGGGMRVKILDAWRWGVPIVSTPVGAEGLRCPPEETLLLADTPTAFAQAVIRLLQQPTVGQQMAAAGRAWVTAHYNWQTQYAGWDQIYGQPQDSVGLCR